MPISDAGTSVQRFPLSRVRTWLSVDLPGAIGIGIGAFAATGSFQRTLFTVCGAALISALLERVRQRRDVVVTADSLSVPALWMRTTTVPLAAIDVATTAVPTFWERSTGLRYIRLLNGSRLMVNAFAIGPSQFNQILALIGCRPTPTPTPTAA